MRRWKIEAVALQPRLQTPSARCSWHGASALQVAYVRMPKDFAKDPLMIALCKILRGRRCLPGERGPIWRLLRCARTGDEQAEPRPRR